MLENFSSVQELDPIRQYCPARVEEEQFQPIKWEDHDPLNHITDAILQDDIGMMPHSFLWPPTSQNQDYDPLSDHQEVEQEIVDTFFNAECFDKDNRNLMQLQVPDQHHCSQGMYDDEVELSEVLIRSSCSSDDHNYDPGGHVTHSVGNVPLQIEEVNHAGLIDHDQGLQIVHLLLGCAEAVGCRDTQLAESILTKISPLVSPWGDSLQRVSYYFAMGLKSRLTHLSFGFMAANEAICQAAKGKDFLHILDLGSSHHHLQWPSLIRNLALYPEGPPKLVRITAIIEDQEGFSDELHQSTQAIVDEASSLSIPIQFHYITMPVTAPLPSLLTKENLDLREGEELIVNCMMHLHKFMKESGGSVKEILQGIKRLGPILLTVVEQDANHNGPFFLGRFLESLHYYSAIFDSMEAARLPRDSAQRMKIETYYYAEEIQNIVATEGLDRIERHQRMDQWRRQLGRAGYQVVGFKSMGQARMMLSVYGCDGYTFATEKGCLLLGWKGRPIMLASAWQVAAASQV